MLVIFRGTNDANPQVLHLTFEEVLCGNEKLPIDLPEVALDESLQVRPIGQNGAKLDNLDQASSLEVTGNVGSRWQVRAGAGSSRVGRCMATSVGILVNVKILEHEIDEGHHGMFWKLMSFRRLLGIGVIAVFMFC